MRKITLNGCWKMRCAEDEKWLPAQVPGSVYSDLLKNEAMPDPFWRENERDAFELLRKDWEYQRVFTVDEDDLIHDRVLLCCHGLDTLAHVTLNEKPVGYADNMHICWEWDVKNLLKAGENILTIHFDSPIEYALAEYEKRPCWCSTDAIPGFSHIRKAHCMFGWDWGPRLPDAGIWKDIELLLVDEVRLVTVEVLQNHQNAQVRLNVKPEWEGNPDYWSYTVFSPEGKAIAQGEVKQSQEASILIKQPELWWPHGYGAQPLYTVKVDVYANHVLQDTWQRRIGLRTLTISRQKDEIGEEFCHVCNGVKLFAMGADYIPEDNILSRVNPNRTRRLLEDAVLANYNTVRIWGGGYYPDDFFYDICDELGLMVWQDLMYACAFYDLTPEFEDSIRIETEQNVKRLRHHPSLALICGNNEMEQFMGEALRMTMRGDLEAFGPKRYSHYSDYVKMYEYLLPKIVKKLAPQTFWWPASPSSGGNFDEPQSPDRGDVHYWDVWHGEKPFTEYRKFLFRYVSEFGFQSFPSLDTVKSFTLPEDRNIFSRIMERHQRNSAANGKILNYLSQTFLYPSDFDNLLYASQLLQAEAIRYGVEHWRRNRGACMGAIVWQLNDCWPVASWSSIDYYGRWKALHYAEKRFFAPIILSCEEMGEINQNPKINEFHPIPLERSIRLNVSNESMEVFSGTVRWALRKPDASVIQEGEQEVSVSPLSSLWLDKIDFGEIALTEYYVSYELIRDGQIMSGGTCLFCAPKHFAFVDPKLQVSRKDDIITVSAEYYARQICIDSDDPDMLLEDNYFDLNGGNKDIRILRGNPKKLRVRSVFDIR